MKPALPLLQQAFQLRNLLEKNFLAFARVLYKIRESEEWKGRYATFREFLADIKIQESTASRLISVYRIYVIEHKISQGKLVKAGWGNLYTAIPLLEKGSADKVVEQATHLRRQDIEDEVRGENECKHPSTITICSVCHRKVS